MPWSSSQATYLTTANMLHKMDVHRVLNISRGVPQGSILRPLLFLLLLMIYSGCVTHLRLFCLQMIQICSTKVQINTSAKSRLRNN